jgi:hypothetical protein
MKNLRRIVCLGAMLWTPEWPPMPMSPKNTLAKCWPRAQARFPVAVPSLA